MMEHFEDKVLRKLDEIIDQYKSIEERLDRTEETVSNIIEMLATKLGHQK